MYAQMDYTHRKKAESDAASRPRVEPLVVERIWDEKMGLFGFIRSSPYIANVLRSNMYGGCRIIWPAT